MNKIELTERDICTKFISTNILFFEKGGPTTEVWFFAHPYPDGYKSYSRSKPLTIAEFDLEKAWWGEAGRNYNLDCKNPHEVEVNHRDPEELMACLGGNQ